MNPRLDDRLYLNLVRTMSRSAGGMKEILNHFNMSWKMAQGHSYFSLFLIDFMDVFRLTRKQFKSAEVDHNKWILGWTVLDDVAGQLFSQIVPLELIGTFEF